ncbi:MAG: type II toxin-antitoxin system Phd/YefM family antitoxin [Actinomycetota bacterium]
MSYPVHREDEFVGRRDFRERLPEILETARRKKSLVFITDRGKPDAVLMPVEEYEAFIELLEDLRDPELISMVKRSRREIEKGGVMGLKELKDYLGL